MKTDHVLRPLFLTISFIGSRAVFFSILFSSPDYQLVFFSISRLPQLFYPSSSSFHYYIDLPLILTPNHAVNKAILPNSIIWS